MSAQEGDMRIRTSDIHFIKVWSQPIELPLEIQYIFIDDEFVMSKRNKRKFGT
jgi:hypothetical protein